MVVSTICCRVSGGRMEGMRRAIMVLPHPGLPIIRSPWWPATAITAARLAFSWPLISLKSAYSVSRIAGRTRSPCDGIFFTLNRIQAFLKISDRQKLRPGAPAFPRQLRFR